MKLPNAWCNPVDANPITAPYTIDSTDSPLTTILSIAPKPARITGISSFGIFFKKVAC